MAKNNIFLKTLVSIVMLGTVAFVGYKVISAMHLPKISSHTVVPTNTVLRSVKKIARLTTARYNDDFVYVCREYKSRCFINKDGKVCDIEDFLNAYMKNGEEIPDSLTSEEYLIYSHGTPNEKIYISDSTENVICYIFKGTSVRAGYDLANLTDDNIYINGDTLVVGLPPIEIFDVAINPDSYEVFDHVGDCWTSDIEQQIFKNATEDLRQKAIDNGLLEAAEKSGMKVLEKLFQSIGYNNVYLLPYEVWTEEDEEETEEQLETPRVQEDSSDQQDPVAIPTKG